MNILNIKSNRAFKEYFCYYFILDGQNILIHGSPTRGSTDLFYAAREHTDRHDEANNRCSTIFRTRSPPPPQKRKRNGGSCAHRNRRSFTIVDSLYPNFWPSSSRYGSSAKHIRPRRTSWCGLLTVCCLQSFSCVLVRWRIFKKKWGRRRACNIICCGPRCQVEFRIWSTVWILSLCRF
jgi:hypothetical protein